MKPEWFVFIGCVLAFIVGLLWSIAAKLSDIQKLLRQIVADHKEGENDG